MRKVFDLNKKIKNKIKRTRDEATSNHLKYISKLLCNYLVHVPLLFSTVLKKYFQEIEC